MEVGSRRILHVNVTPHPTSSWTLQQLREAIPSDHAYRWLIHDRSGIFSENLDHDVKTFGVAVLKTPIRAPKANAYCKRLIGSLRRECLDWFIPLNERLVRMLAREWAVHYNQGRPHKSLGPGIPDPPPGSPVAPQICRPAVSDGFSIKKKSILGGLHHEYRLERMWRDPDEVLAHHKR
jgi:putative transposase